MTANKREMAKMLQAEAVEALKAVAERHGLKVEAKGGAIGAGFFALKFEFAEPGESKEASDFRRYATMYGLAPGDLGRTFRYQGETYTIAGLLPRSSRFPILATSANGRQMKFAATSLKLDGQDGSV